MPIKKFFIAFIFLLSAAVCSYWYFYSGGNSQYSDIIDLDNEYNVDDELQAAQQKLEGNPEPAQIYVNSLVNNEIALTFDGLPDPATTDRILDLLDKYHIKATFFVDGSSAAADDNSLKKIAERNYPIGNYTYAGLSQLDKASAEEALVQLLKTQKVIKILTGTAPDIFKAPMANYSDALLKTAAAAELKAAVKTTVYIKKDDIKTDEDALGFIDTIKPGSIVSLPVAVPVTQIKYTPAETDADPVFEKEPGLKININDNTDHQTIVNVTERLLKAINQRGIQTAYISDFRLVKHIVPADDTVGSILPSNSTQTFLFRIKNNIYQKIAALTDVILFKKAYAAAADYEYLRQKNGGAKAAETKMILTTEPTVCFSFAGLSKPEVVYDVLNRLKQMNATGTFFVMKTDIDKNPQLINDIIKNGNEVGIGIRSLKDSNYYTVCSEIDYVRTKLEAMGASPTLAMQPWGAVDDETREAVSAMGLNFIGPYVNIVKSNMKDYTSPEQVMNEVFGKHVYAMGRGWIVYFRLDYYDDNTLAGRVLDLVKRDKIDNIAYNSFYDDPKINPANDSAYSISSVGHAFNNTSYRYAFASNDNVPPELRSDYNILTDHHINFSDYIKERFIGNPAIGIDSNALGFSIAELKSFDTTGRIHVNKPVVFFTFDDWGTDASINPLLYVLRKHNVKANFFILTHNVMNNPNLLRAIAMQGHDIGAHSDMHKPMSTQDTHTNVMRPSVQSREQYMQDLSDCYKKLEQVVGDVILNGHPALTRYFRPPQLTTSKMGFECLYANGYSYIIDGSYSLHDYDQPDLNSMVNDIKAALYDENGKVKNGAVLVMHMSDNAEYTARALDLLLTANEQRKDGDPAKFIPARLSDYLKDGYDQSNAKFGGDLRQPANHDEYLYKNFEYINGR